MNATELISLELTKIIISAATLFIVYHQLNRLVKQTKINERTEIANAIWQVSDRWTAIYEQRKQVLNLRIKSDEELEEEYDNYKKLLNSPEWNSIRSVLNFYEIVGILIHKELVPQDEVFAIVTVDQYPNADTRSKQNGADGRMYKILHPYILYLRKHYRNDIYHFYDRILVQRYADRPDYTPESDD